MKERTIKITYWIITILFVLSMIYSGILELIQTESSRQLLIQLGYPLYLNPLLGTLKILGVIAILQTRFNTIKEWAYAGFTFDFTGATVSIALVLGVGISILTMIPFFAALFLSYFFWKRTMKLP